MRISGLLDHSAAIASFGPPLEPRVDVQCHKEQHEADKPTLNKEGKEDL